MTDIAPGSKTSGQLLRQFFGIPFLTKRVSHYIEIDVSGLNVVKGRDGVYLVPNIGVGLNEKGAGKTLLPNEEKVGTYKELVKQGTAFDNITPHHMPSAEK